MIGYLKGEVVHTGEDFVIIEVGGIGYNVFMPAPSIELLDTDGGTIKVYTHLLVREDAMQLYGFLTKEDLDLYRQLLSVSGIGPKGALALLSVMSSDELRFAILSGDAAAIGKAPGIGPKTAQRVIIDLKDKIDIKAAFDGGAAAGDTAKSPKGMEPVREEAAEALVALGYSQSESYRAVRSVDKEFDDVESVLKQALMQMSTF